MELGTSPCVLCLQIAAAEPRCLFSGQVKTTRDPERYTVFHSLTMSVQIKSEEESCNLLIQSLIARDEKLLQKVLEEKDEEKIKEIISRIPVNHVRKFLIEIQNLLNKESTVNHLQWLQHLLTIKYSVVSTMADGRSILLPLISLLEDRSSPEYYRKMLELKGKLSLLKSLKETRKTDHGETVVVVQDGPDSSGRMDIDSETESEGDQDDDEDLDAGDEDDSEDAKLDDHDDEDHLDDADEDSEEEP